MKNKKFYSRYRWIKKVSGRNSSLSLLLDAIENSDSKDVVLLECVMAFRIVEPDESKRFKRLRKNFLKAKCEVVIELLGLTDILWITKKLVVKDLDEFLKSTLCLVRKKAIDVKDLTRLAGIIHHTCMVGYSLRTLINRLKKIREENEEK